MSETTNLKLFKHDNPSTNENQFDIERALNENWDKIDESYGEAQENINNLQSGQSTSNTDITNLKGRVSTLETDNTQNKSDISTLKTDNAKNKTNIEELQEDNTQNKSDILDIKEEQETQNKNIEDLQKNDETQEELILKLQQENKNIKSALINVETEQAKSLHIEDASTVAGKLEVEGNAEQETREGYNLIDIINSSLIGQDKGVTIEISEDGYLIANGTPTASYIVFIKKNITNLLEDGQTYSLWQEKYADAENSEIYLQVIANPVSESGTTQYFSAAKNIKTFKVDKTNYSYFYSIQTGTISLAGVFNNYKNRYMLYKGTDNKNFELYGAMPSLKFQSAIKCLGSNKNEFDMTNIESGGYTSGVAGAELSKNSNSTRVRLNNLISAKKNTQYSFSIKTDKALRYNILEVGEDNIIKKVTSVSDTRSTTIITTEETAYITFLFLWQTTTQNITTDDLEDCLIKLEEGTVTSYSPYGQGSTEIKKINTNFLENNLKTSTINGVTATINEDKSITLNGTATNNNYFDLQTNFDTDKFKDFKFYGLPEMGSTSTFNIRISEEDRIAKQDISVDGSAIKSNGKNLFFAIRIANKYTCNNLTIKPMLVPANYEYNKYIPNEQTNDILNIQQEMLQGDYFVKEEDGWKEVHGHYKKIFDGTENIGLTSNGNSFSYTASNPYIKYNTDQTVVLNFWSNRYTKATWSDRNYSNLPNTISSYGNVIGMDKRELSTADEFKQKLTEWKNNNDPLVVFYPIGTPTKLACTEEQSAVLDKLNNLGLFDGTNNIITTEDIALLKLKYVADTKTYIDNQINERLSNIENQIVNLSGGN